MDAVERKEIEQILEKYLSTRARRILPDASPIQSGLVWLRGNLSGISTEPQVVGLTASDGTPLSIGTITDGQYLKRTGTGIGSAEAGGGGGSGNLDGGAPDSNYAYTSPVDGGTP